MKGSDESMSFKTGQRPDHSGAETEDYRWAHRFNRYGHGKRAEIYSDHC